MTIPGRPSQQWTVGDLTAIVSTNAIYSIPDDSILDIIA